MEGLSLHRKIRIITVLLFIVIVFSGCNSLINKNINSESKDKSEDPEKLLSIDPDPQPVEQTITLYFKHKYSDYLVPETRIAVREKQSWEQLVVEQLLKGPNGHDRTALMPPGVRVLDVTRKAEIVFVNLSEEFNGEVDLASISGKEDIPDDKRSAIQAEMKRLAIYSIINSLTEIDGVNQVKFLVENRAISYTDMGAELGNLMLRVIPQTIDKAPTAILVALYRDKSFILTPGKSVQLLFEGLKGEPKWDLVYSLLSAGIKTPANSSSTSKGKLPSKEELQKLWTASISGLELNDKFILDEEIKPDGRALVTISYTVNFASGTKHKRERDLILVVNEDDIWKVRLPEFLNDME